jgi:hypothetical protein
VELVVDSVSWLWILQQINEKSNITTKGRQKKKFFCISPSIVGDENMYKYK